MEASSDAVSCAKGFSEHQWRLWNLLSFLDPFIEGKKAFDVLDIGGTEVSENVLARKFPGSNISVLNTRPKSARNFVIGDAQEMPFHGEAFDILVCIELIEHVYSPQKVFSEAFRVGRANSLFLFTTPNMNACYNRILVPLGFMPANYTVIPYRQYGYFLPKGRRHETGQDHCRIFNLQALTLAMQALRFNILRTFGVNYSEPGHRFSLLRKCMARIMWKTLCENIGVVASKADVGQERP